MLSLKNIIAALLYTFTHVAAAFDLTSLNKFNSLATQLGEKSPIKLFEGKATFSYTGSLSSIPRSEDLNQKDNRRFQIFPGQRSNIFVVSYRFAPFVSEKDLRQKTQIPQAITLNTAHDHILKSRTLEISPDGKSAKVYQECWQLSADALLVRCAMIDAKLCKVLLETEDSEKESKILAYSEARSAEMHSRFSAESLPADIRKRTDNLFKVYTPFSAATQVAPAQFLGLPSDTKSRLIAACPELPWQERSSAKPRSGDGAIDGATSDVHLLKD